MKTCGDPTLHSSDSLTFSSNNNSTMITIHGNNSNNNTATGIAIPPSYSTIETDDLLDDYPTSNFSSHKLSAPPPSPQDASPLDSLFAQHLTSKLQQTFMITTSPPSKYSDESDNNDMDTSPTSKTSSWKTGLPSSVLMTGALPLSYTTTYHHQPAKLTAKHHGVDPHQLDYLLRRVSRNNPSHGQPRSYRSTTKRIGAFHKRPSRIPLYTKRLAKPGEQCGGDVTNSRPSWKESASRQKTLAITTAVEKWKQLKQYEQDDNYRAKSHEEVDRIVHDLKEMGL